MYNIHFYTEVLAISNTPAESISVYEGSEHLECTGHKSTILIWYNDNCHNYKEHKNCLTSNKHSDSHE